MTIKNVLIGLGLAPFALVILILMGLLLFILTPLLLGGYLIYQVGDTRKKKHLITQRRILKESKNPFK